MHGNTDKARVVQKKIIKKHALEIRTTTFWTQRDFDPNLF